MTSITLVSIGSIFIDDVVLHDGRTSMAVLGGSAVYAAAGARVWDAHTGLAAAVGPDFSPAHRAQLTAMGIDLTGVVTRPTERTIRAWQLFEADGRRTQVLRTHATDPMAMYVTAADLPPLYHHTRAFHILSRRLDALPAWIDDLHAREPRPLVLYEPTPADAEAADLARLQPIFTRADIVSPNLLEAGQITGRDTPAAIIAALFDLGASIVALRCGPAGSIVADRSSGATWHIPAVAPTALVDVTGAGNAYCGGFLVGLLTTGDLRAAGRHGAVAASFVLEQFGPPPIDPATHAAARARLAALLP